MDSIRSLTADGCCNDCSMSPGYSTAIDEAETLDLHTHTNRYAQYIGRHVFKEKHTVTGADKKKLKSASSTRECQPFLCSLFHHPPPPTHVS